MNSCLYILRNVQNERAANTGGTVLRGLGMLPQQADSQKLQSGTTLHCLRICEPVQVYTACQFVINANLKAGEQPLTKEFDICCFAFTVVNIGYFYFLTFCIHF